MRRSVNVPTMEQIIERTERVRLKWMEEPEWGADYARQYVANCSSGLRITFRFEETLPPQRVSKFIIDLSSSRQKERCFVYIDIPDCYAGRFSKEYEDGKPGWQEIAVRMEQAIRKNLMT